MDEIEKKLLEGCGNTTRRTLTNDFWRGACGSLKINGESILCSNCCRKLEQHRQTMKWVKENELTFLELLLHLNPSEPVKHQIEIRKKQISGEKV